MSDAPETLAEALMQNGCRIDAFSSYSGPVYGQQPAGFRCTGHGVQANGGSAEAAAKNWLKKFRAVTLIVATEIEEKGLGDGGI